MLNLELKLNKDVFGENVKTGALRDGFGKALLDLGRENKDVVAVCADLTESTRMHWFKEEFPERFFEAGITEQHMASFASGLAAMGKIPFISSYAMFSPGRNWEQIRTTICYNDSPVIVVGSHAGVSVGPDGGTHQAIEDIAIMRVLPRMHVFAPADEHEAYRISKACADLKKPAYIRLAREKTPIISEKDSPFKVGALYEFWRSEKPKITIFACGTSTYNALKAAERLEREKSVGTLLVNVPTIKPIDKIQLLSLASESGLVMTVENHQIAGGLGGVVAEILSESRPMPMRFVGVKDKFGQSGTPSELLEHYELDEDAIFSAALDFLSKWEDRLN